MQYKNFPNRTFVGIRDVYYRDIYFHLIRTEYFYIAKLVQITVLTAHYGEPPYKTCLYEDFLNLYNGGQGNSIFTIGITVPNLR